MLEENIEEQIDVQTESQEEQKKKPNIFLWIVVVVLLLTNILTITYFIYTNKNKPVAVVAELETKKQDNDGMVVDTDKDGLSDLIEATIGTDKNNKDTDGDGYNDKDEVDKGYDPLVNQNSIDNKKEITKDEKNIAIDDGEIMIEWNEWPEKVSDYQIFDYGEVSKLFTTKDVKNMDCMGGSPQTVKDFLDTVDVLKVGRVTKGKYQNGELFLVLVKTFGPGDNILFRIIKSDNEIIVLNKYSSEFSDWYTELFIQDEDTGIANLETPERLSYQVDDKNISLLKNEEEPNLLMTDIDDFVFLFELDGKKYYKNNLSGCIFTNANDGTVREYRYDLEFIEKKESIAGITPRHLDITWLNGEKNTDDYITNSYFGCGRAGCYQFASYIEDINQLIEVGETSTGDSIYELKNKDTKKDKIDEYSILRAMFNSTFMGDKEGNYDKFINDHPLIFWQDPFGDFMEFRNANYQPMAECGKPVIYLYPEEETDVSVYVEPSGGFTVTKPAYNKGWKVSAKPDGELYNYADKTIYPYLFWEGYAHDYYRPEKGFVVARENVEEFLIDKLTQLGLVKHEYDEFIEFWLPKMQDRNYYFVTFMDQSDFDKIAPLTVVPAPDKVIRVFMDYEGMDDYIEVEEPKIITPERVGFTVVEWGGALHK